MFPLENGNDGHSNERKRDKKCSLQLTYKSLFIYYNMILLFKRKLKHIYKSERHKRKKPEDAINSFYIY